MKSEKNYKVSTNTMGMIEVSTIGADGKQRSASAFKGLKEVKKADGTIVNAVETKQDVIKHLCNILGVAY